LVRKLRESDIPVLKELHERRGFGYSFPDLWDYKLNRISQEFADVQVRVDEEDRPVIAVACRKTVEAYLWMDEQWRTPRWRMAALVEIHEAVRVRLVELGVRDIHAWLPPEVCKAFGKRLRQVFGWLPSRWQCWSRRTES
jgi:hypothetical protein